jgi:hypothetical protein
MHCHLYLRKGTVFIPTSGIVHKGLHRDVEPVAVVPVSNTQALRQALHETIARGNPPTPHYRRGSYPQPAVLKYAGVKSWTAFARDASPWSIKEKDGIYQILGKRRHPNGWVAEAEQTIEFPPGSTVNDVIERMVAILQEAARR